jgi:hypothetical protein
MSSLQQVTDRRCRQVRFEDEATRPARRNSLPVVVRFARRDENDCRPAFGGKRDGNREPVSVRKLHVEQHHVRDAGSDRRESFRRVPCFACDDVTRSLEQFSRDGAKRLVIVHDQHALGHAWDRRTPLAPRCRGFP